MGYFWKYTRSGMYSSKYISFIVDVLPSSITYQGSETYWDTSFEEIEKFLILLQDVEVINNPIMGITKPAYAKVVTSLGFTATNSYKISGTLLYQSFAVMGTHSGSALPWGFIQDKTTPIRIKINSLRYSAYIDAKRGLIPFHNDDKLKQYRNRKEFETIGNYWDYMPLHNCIMDFINNLLYQNQNRAYQLIHEKLMWIKD